MLMSTECSERVQETIARHQLFSPGETALVAVSGGTDSVALLHLLAELRGSLRLALHVAHLNHRLRPGADEDARFVQALAAALEIPVTIEVADVRGLAVREKRSLEDAGRVARYAFFARLAARIGAQRVATAHTRDDQVETVMMRLLQGTPWHALAGIPPVRPLGSATVVRPLGELTRAEVTAFLRTRGLRWRDDPTNRDRRFVRNRIRLEVLPAFDQYHPQSRAMLWDLGEVMRSGDEFLSGLAQEAFGHMTRRRGGGITLLLADFQRCPPALQHRLVRRAIQDVAGTNAPLPRVVVEERAVRLGAAGRPGRQVDLGVCLARCGYEVLEILPHPPRVPRAQYDLSVPGTVVAEAFGIVVAADLLDREQVRVRPARPGETYLDAAAVRSPLQVRPWRHGDRFVPLGLTGKKKLQDFFVDAKIPRWERARIPLIADAQDRIVWVVGRRIADTARVTEATQQVLRIRVTPLGSGQA